ncbi:MAG: FAD-dependent oxidoreductase [Bacillota bacterium]|nr:FAD-dependent oxidoreductase [Bacillota bacterium]
MTDIPNFSNSYWIDSLKTPDYPQLKEDITVDAAVIGGGIAGITTAYMLQKEGLKVALVEANKVLAGTTGHTTAKVTIQHGLIYNKIKNHYGEEKARMYGEANSAALKFVRDIVKEKNIDCDLIDQHSYVLAITDEYLQKVENEVKTAQALGLNAKFVEKVDLPFEVKGAVCFENQAMFHPRKYLKALCDLINEKEQCIFEDTRALDIEPGAIGDRELVVIANGGLKIHCDYAVLASHFPFYDGFGMYFARMYPERSYVLGIKTKKEFGEGMYITGEDPAKSLRYVPYNGGKLLLVGGEHHRTGQENNTMVRYENLRDFAEETYGIEKIVYRWSTQDLVTLDDIPYIGYLTQGKHNAFVATGFRKWGMTSGTLSGILIKDLILKKNSPWQELYSPSRFNLDPSLKNLIKDNAVTAKELIKGKLKNVPHTMDDLTPDTAKLISVDGNKVGVYKDADGNLHMVDTTCRHMGCEVQWNSAERSWDCPCHGSRYTVDGQVIEGPALKPLEMLND